MLHVGLLLLVLRFIDISDQLDEALLIGGIINIKQVGLPLPKVQLERAVHHVYTSGQDHDYVLYLELLEFVLLL